MKLRSKIRVMLKRFDLPKYLKEHDPDAKEYGGEIAIRCPDCDKPNKLWVQVTDKPAKPAGNYICYYCDSGGRDIVTLVRKLEDCSLFKAVEIIAQGSGDSQTNLHQLIQDTLYGLDAYEAWEAPPVATVPLPKEFIPITPTSKLPAYFKERGISRQKAMKFGMGYCREGKYANRLVCPIEMNGEHKFFVARYMKKTPPPVLNKKTGEMEPGKKIMYPFGSHPKHALFNYDRARKCDRIILVESVWSALHIGREAMATFGKSLSQYQLELLMQTNAQEIVIIWDRDLSAKPGQGGYDKAQKLAVRLAEFFTVRCVKLPDDRDPADHSIKRLERFIDATEPLDAFKASLAVFASKLATVGA